MSRVLVVIVTLAHAAALLPAQRPFSLIKIFAPPGASTTHNLVAHYLPPHWTMGGFHRYQLTGRKQCSNDSCCWSFQPTRSFSWKSSLLIFRVLAFACLGFTGFKAPGQRSEGFARSSQWLLNISCQGSWPSIAAAGKELCLANHFLLGSTGSRVLEGEGICVCVEGSLLKILSHPFGFGLCLGWWGGCSKGVFPLSCANC